jgi:hypothetical protein
MEVVSGWRKEGPLLAESQQNGTSIGLAYCNKIVQRRMCSPCKALY